MTEPQKGIFGIDLGTTYSCVAYIDETGRPNVAKNNYSEDTTPSVVFFESDTNVVVGKVAKESAVNSPELVVSLIKREMGNQAYRRTFFGNEFTAPAISGLILAALAKDAELQSGRSVTDVVITVPAYFGLLEKESTRQAGEIAGLNVIGIVPEPVAAALHYGMAADKDGKTILVYDLGGGTFDVTLIRLTPEQVEVLVVEGDHRLGGADWDEVLFNYMLDEVASQCGEEIRDDDYALQELWAFVEKTKKELTVAESRTVLIRQGGVTAKVAVSRAAFEQMTSHLLERTLDITERALEKAEDMFPGVRGELTDVLLVGGSSWMPAVSNALTARFGWEPKLSDPNLAVAKGAALYAAGQMVRMILPGDDPRKDGAPASTGDVSGLAQRGPVSDESIAKAVGIKLTDTDVPNWEQMDPPPFYIDHLVPAQTQLEFEAEPYVANTVAANQSGVEIEIWEQAGPNPGREPHENTFIEKGVLNGLGAYSLPAGSPIHINFKVSAEGTVTVDALEPKSGQTLKVEARIAMLDPDQVNAAKIVHAGLAKNT
jgi:molecular chaperone DnaK